MVILVKKKILILIGILFLIAIIFFLIIIPPIKNDNYQKKLFNNIYENTNLKKIDYVNKDNNYYIIKIDNKVIVLDLNYDEIYSKENIRESNLPLVYKRNNIYYEEKIRRKASIEYNYYSTDKDELVFSSVVGGN